MVPLSSPPHMAVDTAANTIKAAATDPVDARIVRIVTSCTHFQR
jgi:hypothetical protein